MSDLVADLATFLLPALLLGLVAACDGREGGTEPGAAASQGRGARQLTRGALYTQPLEVSYFEAIISVPVSHEDVVGTYLPVLYLDKVIPIIGGREIWGFSKLEADIQMSGEGGTVSATVVRNGTTLIDMTAQLRDPIVPVPELSNYPVLNLKLIPSVTEGAPPDVKQLTSTVAGDVKRARSFSTTSVSVARQHQGTIPGNRKAPPGTAGRRQQTLYNFSLERTARNVAAMAPPLSSAVRLIALSDAGEAGV